MTERTKYKPAWNRKWERNTKALELRRSGLTWREVGATLGVTRERARQICIAEEYRQRKAAQ